MDWVRLRTGLCMGLLATTGLTSFACSDTGDPEKPDNQGVPAIQASLPAADGAPAAPPATGSFQTTEVLSRLAREAENKIAPLRQAVETDPTNAEHQHALGRALFDANFKEQAIVHLERAAELNATERTLLDLAIGYAGGARLDDAERTYLRLLELSPDFSIALHNLGDLARRRGDFEQALTYFNRALENEPDYLLARLHAGDSLKAQDRLQEAYRSYEKVLELEPSNAQEANGYIDALYKLAALDLKMGAHDRARLLLTELIRIAPEHDRAYYAYGQVLLFLGHPEQAQRAFDKHVEILAAENPTSPVAMSN
jgi:tetratricopeptide (TPR) repeat protein